MTERPILMSAPMVCALRQRIKTQTRRIVKGQPLWLHTQVTPAPAHGPFYLDDDAALHCKYISAGEAWFQDGMNRCAVLSDQGKLVRCPYGKPGDRLWVRETWLPCCHGSYEAWPRNGGTPVDPHHAVIQYRTDAPIDEYKSFWRSPIHMPRWASRITLEITEVRVQRLQEISEEDAIAEGCKTTYVPADPELEATGNPLLMGSTLPATAQYWALWESINGKGSWDANPWVWAVTFKEAA